MITLYQNVLIAVNSHGCYIWIVNDITDSNICFLLQFFCFVFYFGIVCVRWCVCMFVCLHDYIVTKCFNNC